MDSAIQHMATTFWGSEITPASIEFDNESVKIDVSKYLKPGTTITTMMMYKNVVESPMMGRGVVEAFHRFKIAKDDIVLAGLMKTGTTWVQDILYNLMHPDEIDQPATVPIDIRIPTIELPECGLDSLNEKPSPRLLKTHQPYHLLPPGICDKKYKIIYVIRNLKDTAVSTFHFFQMMTAAQFSGTLNELLNLYINDRCYQAPFGSHVLSYWNNRHLPNIHIIKYEDMQKDVVHEIRRLAKFLGVGDAAAEKLAEKCSFKKMAENPNSHHGHWTELKNYTKENTFPFMRKGKVGDWKNHFDEDINRRFDEYLAKSFANSDITFDYEL